MSITVFEDQYLDMMKAFFQKEPTLSGDWRAVHKELANLIPGSSVNIHTNTNDRGCRIFWTQPQEGRWPHRWPELCRVYLDFEIHSETNPVTVQWIELLCRASHDRINAAREAAKHV